RAANFQEPPADAEYNLVSYASTLNMKHDITQNDLEPAEVRDLRVVDVTRKGMESNATLSWTCMGAHLDSGHAKHTDLRASLNPLVLLHEFENATVISNDDLLEGSLDPLEPYEYQMVRIRLPRQLVYKTKGKPGSVFLGLRSYNSRGAVSSVSNIVPLIWGTAPMHRTVAPTKVLPTSANDNLTKTPNPGSRLDTVGTPTRPIVAPSRPLPTSAEANLTKISTTGHRLVTVILPTTPEALKGKAEASYNGTLLGIVAAVLCAAVVVAALRMFVGRG
ncbi:unnamed protein product, partial [Ixodes hexagonus]